jgi:cobalt/nickel transport system permease protein
MPEWLTTTENYTPVGDKDTFLSKSVLSMFSLIARIRAQDRRLRDLFFVQPVFRVLFTLLLIVLLSLSRSFAFVLVVITYLTVLLALMPAKDIVAILKVSITVTLFTLVILLPAAFYGNSYSMTMIPPKVFATVTAVNIVNHATRWSNIIGALRRFYVPDLIIFVLDITLKYIVMLGELALEMLYALRLRSVGRNKSKVTSLGGVAGTIFLKSRLMAEEMVQAMECRGFSGKYPVRDRFRFGIADALYVLLNGCLVYVFIFLS